MAESRPKRSASFPAASWSRPRSTSRGGTDFDSEGRKLVQRIAQGGANASQRAPTEAVYRNLDEIYSAGGGGGRVFVGNHIASRQLETLQKHGIRNVVNCMDPTAPNWHEHSGAIRYFRFPVAYFWSDARTRTPAGVVEYFTPLFQWIDAAVARGEGVLIHCLAGAHRAGTTGVAYLMHRHGLSAIAATALAKRCRPIIDPIADFPILLRSLQAGLAEKASAPQGGGTALPPRAPAGGGAARRPTHERDSAVAKRHSGSGATGGGLRGARILGRSRASSTGRLR
eukprot:TRINITY_DN47096_c0_g1_i1.p1 TRINITY_DN47096_c0_g1~~TRINITY_DN47096_c0_g1_i1.p1  ORF type:complete len:312 (+),score=37.54 TRINITY_DN47096_c0_g1_i1:85-936(+)